MYDHLMRSLYRHLACSCRRFGGRLEDAKLVSMILLAVGTAPPALATKHVTIAHLEQILDTLKGESDARAVAA